MRVLFISEYFSGRGSSETGGTDHRMSIMIDAASRVGPVDFLFFVPGEDELLHDRVSDLAKRRGPDTSVTLVRPLLRLHDPPLRELWSTVSRSLARGAFSFFTQTVSLRTSGTAQVRALETALDRAPDVIVAHRIGAMAPLLMTHRTLPEVVFDLDNLEHVKWHRIMMRCPTQRHPPPYHWLVVSLLWVRYLLTRPLLLRAEREAIRLAASTFVCSDQDRAALQTWGVGHVVTVPNAVTVAPPAGPTETATVLFVGNYGARANVDAAEFLIREIWPSISEMVPDARLVIAGQHPERIKAGRAPGVEFSGFVENLDALYQQARIVVCPVRAGSGTRVKILEAAGHGKPIVSTTVGAEGLDMTDGQHILLRDDPASFSGACVELLSDPERCRLLGDRARSRILEAYERSSIVADVAKQIVAAVVPRYS